MRCDICGRDEARRRRVTRTYGRGLQRLLIRNVPVVACGACGETYMTRATVHAIERIKRERPRGAKAASVEAVEFGRRGALPARTTVPIQQLASSRRR